MPSNKQGTEKCCQYCITHNPSDLNRIVDCTNSHCTCHSPQVDTPEEWFKEHSQLPKILSKRVIKHRDGHHYIRVKFITEYIKQLQQEAFEKGREAERKEIAEAIEKYISDGHKSGLEHFSFDSLKQIITLITQRGSKS